MKDLSAWKTSGQRNPSDVPGFATLQGRPARVPCPFPSQAAHQRGGLRTGQCCGSKRDGRETRGWRTRPGRRRAHATLDLTRPAALRRAPSQGRPAAGSERPFSSAPLASFLDAFTGARPGRRLARIIEAWQATAKPHGRARKDLCKPLGRSRSRPAHRREGQVKDANIYSYFSILI